MVFPYSICRNLLFSHSKFQSFLNLYSYVLSHKVPTFYRSVFPYFVTLYSYLLEKRLLFHHSGPQRELAGLDIKWQFPSYLSGAYQPISKSSLVLDKRTKLPRQHYLTLKLTSPITRIKLRHLKYLTSDPFSVSTILTTSFLDTLCRLSTAYPIPCLRVGAHGLV